MYSKTGSIRSLLLMMSPYPRVSTIVIITGVKKDVVAATAIFTLPFFFLAVGSKPALCHHLACILSSSKAVARVAGLEVLSHQHSFAFLPPIRSGCPTTGLASFSPVGLRHSSSCLPSWPDSYYSLQCIVAVSIGSPKLLLTGAHMKIEKCEVVIGEIAYIFKE